MDTLRTRSPRFHKVVTINQAHKDLLVAIAKFNSTHPYKAIPTDFSPEYGSYNTVLSKLHRLESSDWIKMHHKRNVIRAIDVLAIP